MKYLWLLFDADDTLFDYPKAEAKALQGTFGQLGLSYRSDYLPIYHKYNQQVWREFEQSLLTTLELRTKRFRLLFTEIGIVSDPQLFSPLYLKNLARRSDLFDGVAKTLQTLSKCHHIGLVTNGLADVQRPRLENSPIYTLIEKVFISEEIGAAKPDKAYFDIVFQGIGNPNKSEVLIVGDSLTSDMLGGIQYGLDTCWVNPSKKTTDLPVTYQIQTIPDLIPLLS